MLSLKQQRGKPQTNFLQFIDIYLKDWTFVTVRPNTVLYFGQISRLSYEAVQRVDQPVLLTRLKRNWFLDRLE